MTSDSKIPLQEASIEKQIEQERTFSRPPAANWGIKILKTLKLEKLLTLGNSRDL